MCMFIFNVFNLLFYKASRLTAKYVNKDPYECLKYPYGNTVWIYIKYPQFDVQKFNSNVDLQQNRFVEHSLHPAKVNSYFDD